MKNFIFLILLIPILAFSQVPQGVGYQGVATDASGIELVNQAISIRASVLSGSATGTIEWQETHNTSTDTFGLFTLSIGEGTSNGNGSLISFSDISWGSSTHFLKIEMDVNGGTNYSFMGTNQLMSVPYALYAENANINYDSISTLLSNDSTFITTVSGGVGGGCDFRYPEGVEGEGFSISLQVNGTYIVPSGKRFYIHQLYFGGPVLSINGINISENHHNLVIANPGDTIEAEGGIYGNISLNILSVNATPNVEALTFLLPPNGNYTVPSGKRFYIHQKYSAGQNRGLKINGFTINYNDEDFNLIIANPGDILERESSMHGVYLNGYLVDENYFADCGGGGSSSSTVDSSYIDSLVQFYSSGNGGGCDLNYPDGMSGEIVDIYISSSNNNNYTVPTGKRLYISRLTGNGLDIDGVEFFTGVAPYGTPRPLISTIIADENQTISLPAQSSEIRFIGMLVDASVSIEPISYSLSSNYTIPASKILVITYVNRGTGSIQLNGNGLIQLSEITFTAFPLESGGVLDGSGSFNGYLVDENYFADCGGGGDSSSSGGSSNNNSGNMIVSTFGDTLTINGQSIFVPGISYANIIPPFGSVTDTSGNTYTTIDYGIAGEWMTENLITENYANGDLIPMMTGNYHGVNNPYAAWTWPQNSSTNESIYGKMYNGYAVHDTRNVCPSGWHIPSISEWIQLFDLFGNTSLIYNGADFSSGNAFKAINISTGIPWDGLGSGNNHSYMSLVPSGMNYGYITLSSYSGFNSYGYYWTDDTGYIGGGGGYMLFEAHIDAILNSAVGNDYFISVRCKKD